MDVDAEHLPSSGHPRPHSRARPCPFHIHPSISHALRDAHYVSRRQDTRVLHQRRPTQFELKKFERTQSNQPTTTLQSKTIQLYGQSIAFEFNCITRRPTQVVLAYPFASASLRPLWKIRIFCLFPKNCSILCHTYITNVSE
ncbi:unnamed protein product [Ceratitis capitata]|uniref:(Mediterranean fruit fly) hypothetical protein n=1 Tax=Ceratitis capitata TaxID=7213 RepID=A0A811V8Z7_CERCA|nr:unnamed protein product [Ceratitis capitata]